MLVHCEQNQYKHTYTYPTNLYSGVYVHITPINLYTHVHTHHTSQLNYVGRLGTGYATCLHIVSRTRKYKVMTKCTYVPHKLILAGVCPLYCIHTCIHMHTYQLILTASLSSWSFRMSLELPAKLESAATIFTLAKQNPSASSVFPSVCEERGNQLHRTSMWAQASDDVEKM